MAGEGADHPDPVPHFGVEDFDRPQLLPRFSNRESWHAPHRPLYTKSASVPNFSRVIRVQSQEFTTESPYKKQSSSRYSTVNTRKATEVKRWDPRTRTSAPWDELRHDEEIWAKDGDCAIHFYGRGRSQRGPSLRIYSDELDAASCAQTISLFPSSGKSECRMERFANGPSSNGSVSLEIFVAAPEDSQRGDAFRWHVTTRNFFAWMTKKPLVGTTLSEALIDLFARMQVFRPQADNLSDLMLYTETLGYREYVHCPDYALAFLRFAEHCQLTDLWIDAFAHCVGMNDQLCMSPEFDSLSRVTKALITRASLEMDLHLGRVSRALRTFLEEELSPARFGLPDGALAHLDRFRSFLHSFYVNRFGYWPPEQGSVFSKTLLRSMHSEFLALYSFLVDTESSDSMQDQTKPASGGICVLQNVNAFDQRHNYEPLPHALPLIPEHQSTIGRIGSQRGLRAFKLGTKPTKFEQTMTVRSALAMATNQAPGVIDCQLVKDYVHFEREWSAKPQEKISVTDARKVRWIAIYSILQMLISVTRSPKEVRHPNAASYHLCLLTEGTPPWGPKTKAPVAPVVEEAIYDLESLDKRHSRMLDVNIAVDIHPDCEFDSGILSRSISISSLRPAPLRVNSGGLSRMSSFKSFSKHVLSSVSAAGPRASVSTPSYTTSVAEDNSSSSSAPTQRQDSEPSTADAAPHTPPRRTGPPSIIIGTPALEAQATALATYMSDTSSSTSWSASSSVSTSSPASTYSPASVTSSFWEADDAASAGWSSSAEDERRGSKGVYSMDHDSVCGSGSFPSAAAVAGKEGEAECGVVLCDDVEMDGVDVKVDILRALDLLPHHIAAQVAVEV